MCFAFSETINLSFQPIFTELGLIRASTPIMLNIDLKHRYEPFQSICSDFQNSFFAPFFLGGGGGGRGSKNWQNVHFWTLDPNNDQIISKIAVYIL